MILPGSASQSLASALSGELQDDVGLVEHDVFADGEFKVTVPTDVDRAIVVASTVSSDAHLEVLQLQDAAREAGASEVVTVVPYLGYARQDEAFRPGEPVSARAVARAISTGTDRVLTVNPHEPAVCDFFDVPATAVDASDRLAEPLPGDLTDPLFVAPDANAATLAVTVRDAYGAGETDHFEKVRDRETGEVHVRPSDATTPDRDVVLVDDIVATGGTMSRTIEQLDDPAAVYVTCVHPVLAANARSKLARVGVEAVYGTDTVERAVSAVSAAPPVAASL